MSAVESFFAILLFPSHQGEARRAVLNGPQINLSTGPMSFEGRKAIQDIEMRAPSPPENRVRFADSVTAFADCLLWEAMDKKISQNQEWLGTADSQRWEEILPISHLVMEPASRSTAAVQQFFTVSAQTRELAVRDILRFLFD
jgi:hypothetical protein